MELTRLHQIQDVMESDIRVIVGLDLESDIVRH